MISRCSGLLLLLAACGGGGSDPVDAPGGAVDVAPAADARRPPDAPPDVVSCRTIHAADPGAASGVFTLHTPEDGDLQAYCDMTRDGGGWTLAASYPPGSPAIPDGWSSGAAVGTFTDPAVLFKMPDLLMRRLALEAFAVDGRATECGSGPCAVEVTRYFSGACRYDSQGQGDFCTNAFFDLGFTQPTPSAIANTPCTWHHGLVDATCGGTGTFVTNHADDPYGLVVCVGDDVTWSCNQRGTERSSLQIWLR